MGNIVEDLHDEELHGEMSYIFEDGVERFIGESGFNSMSDGKNEKNIVEVDEEDYNQWNAHGNDDVVYGHGVKEQIHIAGRCQFEW